MAGKREPLPPYLPNSARAQVLSSVDLLPEVFVHLDPTKKHQLLQVGLTCKVFLDPILDLIWADVSSLKPLLKLIPGPDLGRFYALRSSDWAIFDKYAARVRILTLGFDTFPPHLYIRLSQQHPPPLIPNLRELIVNDLRDGFSSVFLFLQPSVHRLNLHVAAPLDFIIPDMMVHNTLTHLRFQGPPGLLQRDFMDFLQFNTLQSLDIGRTSMEYPSALFLQQLAHMNDLRHLSIPVSTQLDYFKMHFPALEELEMSGDIQAAHRFLDSVVGRRLASFSCYDDGTSRSQPLSSLIDVLSLISSKFPRTRHARFFYEDYLDRENDDARNMFQILGRLPFLEEFEAARLWFSTPEEFEFSWALVSLKSLSLLSITILPFSFLELIARHCPSLQRLKIGINLSSILEYTPPASFHSISPVEDIEMQVEMTQDNHIPHAEQFIHRLFPRLKVAEIRNWWDTAGGPPLWSYQKT